VPDLFQRIRPILLSFVPGRPDDPRVEQLKPWVRYAVTGWVVVVVPIIAFQMIMVVLVTPRLFGTALDSLTAIWQPTSAAFAEGRWLAGLAGVVQVLVLVLPLAGIVYLFWMLGVRFVRGWRDTKGRPVARSMLSVTGIAALALLAFAWWPDPRRYEPIRADEQWVLPTALDAVSRGGPNDVVGADLDPEVPGGGPSASPRPDTTSTTAPSASASPSPSTSPTASASPTPSPSSTTATPNLTPSPTSPTPSATAG
jgi:putative peptide zinc metalloprotease protein